MSKFCTNCGKPLIEGQQCECLKKYNEADSIAINNDASNQSTDILAYFKEMYEFALNFIKAPSILIKLVAQKEDFKIGLFFLGLQALFSGFLIMLTANKAVKAAEDFMGGFGSLLGMASKGIGEKIPYFSLFLKDIIYIGIQFFALAFIIYIISKFFFKGNASFKAIIGVLGVATIPVSLILAVSLILVFISIKLVLYLVIFSIILTILLNAIGIKECFNMSEDKAVYSITISYLVYYFLLFIIISENIKSSLGGLF